jgi:hypothetical protein
MIANGRTTYLLESKSLFHRFRSKIGKGALALSLLPASLGWLPQEARAQSLPPQTGTVEFFDATGSPMAVDVNGVSRNTISYNFAGKGGLNYHLSSNSTQWVIGWARVTPVTGDQKMIAQIALGGNVATGIYDEDITLAPLTDGVRASATFNFRDGKGGLYGYATLEGNAMSNSFSFPLDYTDSNDSGMAIVNPTNKSSPTISASLMRTAYGRDQSVVNKQRWRMMPTLQIKP